jgi:hypothetical protein
MVKILLINRPTNNTCQYNDGKPPEPISHSTHSILNSYLIESKLTKFYYIIYISCPQTS